MSLHEIPAVWSYRHRRKVLKRGITQQHSKCVSQSVHKNMAPFASWYHDVLTREATNHLLRNSPINSWLVRKSPLGDRYVISILSRFVRSTDERYVPDPTVTKGQLVALEEDIAMVKHFIIHCSADGMLYIVESQQFKNINDLVTFYRVHPLHHRNQIDQGPFLSGDPIERQLRMDETAPTVEAIEPPPMMVSGHQNRIETREDAEMISGDILPLKELQKDLIQCGLEVCHLKGQIRALSDSLTDLSQKLHRVLTAMNETSITTSESGLANASPPSPGTKLKAIASYQPAYFDELQFQVGDVLTFLDQIQVGWWRGKLNSKVGVFPSNYVMVLESIDDSTENGGQVYTL